MRRLRTAKGASEYLKEKGLTIAESTLGKYRVIGCGPRFRKWGRQPLYDETDLDEWADRRLGALRRSTSEVHRVADQPAPANPVQSEPPVLIGHNGGALIDVTSAATHPKRALAVRARPAAK